MRRVCAVEEVPPGEGRAVRVGDHRLALFRTAAGWYAIDDRCPHAGGPLADGIAADRSVICPLHERRFSLETGKPIGHQCAPVRAYPVEVRDDQVFVELHGATSAGARLQPAAEVAGAPR